MIVETDLAYVAGIIDGEGSIVIYQRPMKKIIHHGKYGDRTPKHELNVSVGMTDRKIPYYLKDLFGGSVCGVTQRSGNRKPFWKWSVTGQRASDLLKRLLPFLKTKALQAQTAIVFQDTKKNNPNGGAGGSKQVPKEIINKRIELMEINKRLNGGYDPEFMGGYYDC